MTRERKKTTQPLEDNKAINVKAGKQILQRYTEQLWTTLPRLSNKEGFKVEAQKHTYI